VERQVQGRPWAGPARRESRRSRVGQRPLRATRPARSPCGPGRRLPAGGSERIIRRQRGRRPDRRALQHRRDAGTVHAAQARRGTRLDLSRPGRRRFEPRRPIRERGRTQPSRAPAGDARAAATRPLLHSNRSTGLVLGAHGNSRLTTRSHTSGGGWKEKAGPTDVERVHEPSRSQAHGQEKPDASALPAPWYPRTPVAWPQPRGPGWSPRAPIHAARRRSCRDRRAVRRSPQSSVEAVARLAAYQTTASIMWSSGPPTRPFEVAGQYRPVGQQPMPQRTRSCRHRGADASGGARPWEEPDYSLSSASPLLRPGRTRPPRAWRGRRTARLRGGQTEPRRPAGARASGPSLRARPSTIAAWAVFTVWATMMGATLWSSRPPAQGRLELPRPPGKPSTSATAASGSRPTMARNTSSASSVAWARRPPHATPRVQAAVQFTNHAAWNSRAQDRARVHDQAQRSASV